jgi:pimeloyl-ACP methyl ester carboxylesterase
VTAPHQPPAPGPRPPTQFARSPDGTRLAYDVSGDGPPLLLLHGLGGSRQMWHEDGVVAALQSHGRAITMDLRGHGESDVPTAPELYHVEQFLADLDAVSAACSAERVALWGWSFGATISCHYAARSARPTRAVIAGTVFGPIFTEEWLGPTIRDWEAIWAAQTAGTLDRLDETLLTPQRRVILAEQNIPAALARWRGMLTWPGIAPAELVCPALVITGTEDTNVVHVLEAQRAAIEAAGLELIIFTGLDHRQLVSETAVVLPRILPFLQGLST